MPDISIKYVRTRQDRLKFIKMPWKIYRNDPHWVPPLIFDQLEFIDPEKGVFFEYGEAELMIAERGGKTAGRISAHVNPRHEEVYHDGKGFFGFFECEDNIETARALFKEAERYLKSKGKTSIEGPFSFSIYDEMGILAGGFDSDPYVLNTHNPQYYGKLLEKCGFHKSIDWYAFRARAGKTDKNIDPRYFKIRQRIMKNPSIKIFSLEGKNLDREAEKVKKIFFEAWNKNWGHVNLSGREWERIKSALKPLAIRSLSFIAEFDGRPAGFALSIYDANQAVKKMNGRLFPFGFVHLLNIKNTDRFRLMLMGVLEQYRHLGLEIVMNLNIIEKGVELGFKEAEESNIVETNDKMLSSMKHLDVERYKTYRIYLKNID